MTGSSSLTGTVKQTKFQYFGLIVSKSIYLEKDIIKGTTPGSKAQGNQNELDGCYIMTWTVHRIRYQISSEELRKIVHDAANIQNLSRYLSWLRHNAHQPGRSEEGARVQFPGSASRFRVRIQGACFEINFSGRQRGFNGVIYNLWLLANIQLSDAQ